ncbi:MAG: hypothetical protein ACK2U9_18355, partial [Anaerolineae bacterium]
MRKAKSIFILWYPLGVVVIAVLSALPAAAGVGAVFADGFESGGTTVWEQPTRYVVFEGFYVPT